VRAVHSQSNNRLHRDNPQERRFVKAKNMTSIQWLKNIPQNIGWYLSGFADGEGSFNISLKKDAEYATVWKVDPSFNVSQRDISNLILFKKILGTGTLRKRKDGVVYFEVRNYRMLAERVIPFFEKFSFRSVSKQKNFSLFKKVIALMMQGRHLCPEGLRAILELRERLNPGRGRKRKYSLDTYLRSQI